MPCLISIVIPNYNGSTTIGKCLEAVFASSYQDFEVIVVDDCSRDTSVEIIKPFPCRLLALTEHAGAAKARNIGVEHAKGEIVFFIDADCLLTRGVLSRVCAAYERYGPSVVIGGTYTKEPYDHSFFSRFQSVFIHYSELKKQEHPDYIATHAMVISASTFKSAGGFWQGDAMPILEDIEFSHRLRRKGFRLRMDPDILVQHIFNYDFKKSVRNAVRKSRYWTCYSLRNKDVFTDSGTASIELKCNVLCWCLSGVALLFCLNSPSLIWCSLLLVINLSNLYINWKLVREMHQGMDLPFVIQALSYYFAVYPLAVGLGVTAGIWHTLTVDRKT